ncbi:MAG: hypothetical protein ABI581_11470, partial [Sediminibacterium sp.]
MSKHFGVVLLFTLFRLSSFEQTPITNSNAVVFCKVWGFLKYHHPALASGNTDWDSVFVMNISVISKRKNKVEYNNQLEKIIDDAGKITMEVDRTSSDMLFTSNLPDSISWIDRSNVLSSKVKAKLKFIYQNKNQGLNRYIKIINNTADYSGENKYELIGFPNEAHRLLFLTRFWNIINYYAPYKYLVEENWDTILNRFIPRFVSAKDSVSYYKVLLELAKSLSDGHCQLSKSYQVAEINNLVLGKYTVPFFTDILDAKVIVRRLANDSLCRQAGITKGDVILKAGNISISQLIKERKKYISASNKSAEAHLLSRFILDGQTPFSTLT